MSEWISVSNKDQTCPAWAWVLGFPDRDGEIYLMQRSKFTGKWYGHDGEEEKPTHWMPLPEPPK